MRRISYPQNKTTTCFLNQMVRLMLRGYSTHMTVRRALVPSTSTTRKRRIIYKVHSTAIKCIHTAAWLCTRALSATMTRPAERLDSSFDMNPIVTAGVVGACQARVHLALDGLCLP